MNTNVIFPISVGDIAGYVINDGVQEEPLDTGIIFPDVLPRDMDQALEAYEIDREATRLCRNCLLLDIEDQKILIDTGLGHVWDGELFPALKELGIDPAKIDHVIITHGHGDHVLGGLDKDKKLIFANAHYWMWHSEWEFWFNEERYGDTNEYPADHPTQYFTEAIKERITLIDNEDAFIPGLRAIPTAGHTLGHMGLRINSEGENLLVLGDLFLYPFQVEHLEWCTPYDRYPEFVIESRKRALKLAEELEAHVLHYHFESPGLGFIEKYSSGWRWIE